MSNNKKWRVWLDKDGHITSHRPYLDTSPVRWLEVVEVPADVDVTEVLAFVDGFLKIKTEVSNG